MDVFKEALMALDHQQQQQQQLFMQQQQEQKRQQEDFMNQISAFLVIQRRAAKRSKNGIIGQLSEFTYDPENGLTFDAWFVRYKGLFQVDVNDLDDAAKVRLLLRQLSTNIHKQYVDFILPKEYKEFDFETTIAKLTHMFGKKTSLFHQRFNCMNTLKSSNQDFLAYAALINKRCEEFKISTITADQFKCLIFACGLRSPSDANIRMKLLNLIETRPDTLTTEDLAIECQKLINLKHDTSLIQNQKSEIPGTVALVKSKQSKPKIST
ncbi:uncharacterized protein LOC118646919 [Monomorium pharaonis]|uniref:uncharacterized protein LOC118646919 n=1 Tax=Monomorium pharaonis TaxID=307658 RepID=UPI001746E787|nr:uncharacterized protein LOC118646919 [Monomorium pharaonis]